MVMPASIYIIIRNNLGEVSLARENSLGSSISILQAEAWALIVGLKGAAQIAFIISRLKEIIW